MRQQNGLATAGLLLTIVGFASAAEPASRDVERLVQQLGSPRYGERQQASLELEKLGRPALESLTKAAAHPDAEVRKRAEDLIQIIERRLESERLLTPTLLKLDYRDTPVGEAVADLSKRTGYPIELQNRDKLAERTVTVQTAELSFWDAVTAFCDKSQLSVLTPEVAATQPAQPATRDMDARVRQQLELELRRQAMGQLGALESTRLTLVDAKPTVRPTAVVGAVRVRALSPGAGNKNDREIALALEVFPEPKLQWRGLIGLRVDKAVDEANQTYAQSATDLYAGNPGDPEMVVWRNGNGVLIQQVQVKGQIVFRGDMGASPSLNPFGGPTLLNLRLSAEEGVGKTLKLLKGVLSAQVQAPTEPLVMIDDLLRDDGNSRMFRMKDGGELVLRKAVREDNGDIRLRMGLTRPAHVAVPAPRQVGGRPGDNDLSTNLDLVDQTGERYVMLDQAVTHVMNNGVVSRELNARFRPKATTAQPKRLQYVGTRLAIVDIPFELKDVPLPQ